MKISQRIEKKRKDIIKRTNSLYHVYLDHIGSIIDRASDEALLLVVRTITVHKDINYRILSSHGTKAYLRNGLTRIFDDAADKIEHYWGKKRERLDLFTRLGMAYVGKISRPPWEKVQVNLKDPISMDERFDPRMGHIHYNLSSMVDAIMKQIQRGALNGETHAQVIKRVQALFNKTRKKGVRGFTESANDPDSYPPPIDSSFGPVEVQGGFYGPEEIAGLKSDLIDASNWEGRQYRPWFTDELKANNRDLRNLEQSLLQSAMHVINDSQIKMGTDLAGVKDFKWFVTRPGVCDCCDRRAGLTMTEIKAKIKDQYRDAPPPLHPSCLCSLAPVIDDKFKDSELSDQGVSWDPGSGLLKIPKEVQSRYRTDLSIDQFMNLVKNGGIQ